MPLSDLITALAAATGPSRELDERLADEVFGLADINEWWPLRKERWFGKGDWCGPAPAYTSSLDAITGALEQRWPHCLWRLDNDGPCAELQHQHLIVDGHASAPGQTAAMCLSLAAARLAEREAGDE